MSYIDYLYTMLLYRYYDCILRYTVTCDLQNNIAAVPHNTSCVYFEQTHTID